MPNQPDHLHRAADEFVCSDCGRTIYSLPPIDPPPTRCATCAWILEFIADPIERAAIRARLQGEN